MSARVRARGRSSSTSRRASAVLPLMNSQLRLREPQLEGQRGVRLPGVSGDEREGRREVGDGRAERDRGLGLPARLGVQPRDAVALRGLVDQLRAGVELAHHVEELLAQLLRGQARQQQPADAQVDGLALRLGDEGMGRLLDAIMEEAVLLRARAHQQAFLERGLEALLHLARLLHAGEGAQQLQREGVAHARRQPQQVLGPGGSWRSLPTMKSTTLSE